MDKNKIFKFVIGLLLLPTAFCVFWAGGELVWALVKNFRLTFYFLLGAFVFLAIHKIYSFSWFYVASHEITHAAAALLCGHKVKSVDIKEESGNVKISGSNTFILLAPYVFPLLSVVTVIIYCLVNLFANLAPIWGKIFLGLLGFFTALHLLHTYKALTETQQSDIKYAGGGIFSFPIIVLFNMAVVIVLLEFLFPGVVPLWQILAGIFKNTIFLWKNFFAYSHKFIVWAAGR